MAFVLTVFDCETTGLHPSGLADDKMKPELIEFMAIKMDIDTKTKIKEYEFLVKPKRAISKESVKITGINDEMVQNEQPFSFYVTDIRDALENTDAVVAHNLSFDMEMIDTEAKRCGIEIKWPSRLICTVEQTIPIRGYRLKLSELHQELFGMKFDGAHRARQDVEALTRCVELLFDRGFI